MPLARLDAAVSASALHIKDGSRDSCRPCGGLLRRERSPLRRGLRGDREGRRGAANRQMPGRVWRAELRAGRELDRVWGRGTLRKTTIPLPGGGPKIVRKEALADFRTGIFRSVV